MKTTQITIRNVDPLLKRRIDKLAKLKAMSINSLVLETLRDRVGQTENKKTIDWQSYSGVMDDGAINQDVLDDFERIDPKQWEDL